MKKAIFAIALAVMAFNAMAYTVMTHETYQKTWIPPSEYEQNTEYYEFRFIMTTPYGVILRDEEGNPVLDEKNSPVIVFNEVSMQWRAVLRVQNYKGNRKMEWAILDIPDDADVPDNGTGGISWEKATGVSMVNVIMESGETRTYFRIPFVSPERGEGLGKASCLAAGSCYMKIEHGKNVITYGSGSITGCGEDESRALGMAEPATPLVPTPVDGLSVFGSVRIDRRGGELNFKQLRNILKTKCSVKVLNK